MTTPPVKSLALVALAGAAAGTGIAVAGGVGPAASARIVAYALVGAIVGSAGCLVVLRLARHRSVAVMAATAALAPLVAVAVAVGLAAWQMFVSGHDAVITGVVLAAAATLGLMISVVIGSQVAAAGTAVRAMVRRLADPDAQSALGPAPAAGSPSELRDLALELEAIGAALARARQEAESGERARRELVAWVSHDLRTPLAGIRAMVEAMEDGVVADAGTISRYHRTIATEVGHLSALVDDLFELSRIEAGALRLRPDWIPVDQLLEGVLPAAPANGPALQVIATYDGGPLVAASVPEMNRIVRNLVDNAVRHTPDHGAVIVQAGADGGNVQISVSDGCGGIPVEDIDRVFEAGFRGDRARTPGDGRGGLGLAVAQGLAAAHGARITVANTGPGCRFTLTFPPDRVAWRDGEAARDRLTDHRV